MPEKKWIFDSVTLSNFLLSRSRGILEKRYSKKGFLTTQVFDEVCAGAHEASDLNQIHEMIRRGFFQVISLSVSEMKTYEALLNHLGRGEASVIVSAKTQGAIVVTDDRAARAECSRLRIPFTGTIGILLAAVRDKQIKLPEADAILLKMIAAGFYSPVRSISDIA